MLEVRDAVAGDADAIAEINAAGWRTAYRGLVPDDRIQGIPVRAWAREIRANLSDPADGHVSLAAESERAVVGSSFAVRRSRDGDLNDACELVAVYVHPDRWRHGIGAALVSETLRRVQNWGKSEISLWTLVGNDPALAFYERFGWKPDGSRQIHPAARALALRMRRDLGGPVDPPEPLPPASPPQHGPPQWSG